MLKEALRKVEIISEKQKVSGIKKPFPLKGNGF